MKVCNCCGVNKRNAEFYKTPSKAGRESTCKTCRHIAALRRQKANLGKYLVSNARTRARNLGIPFDLTAEDVQIPTHCPVFGFRLKSSLGTGKWDTEDSPSLDRFIPELGYVKGNVTVISNLANRIKSSATTKQLYQVADWSWEKENQMK